MFCPRCGSENDNNDKFCKSCGYKLLDKQHQISNSLINRGLSDTYPLYDSLSGFLTSLIPPVKEMVKKDLLYLIVPAFILAIVTYFGIYQYVIYLIADVADGFNDFNVCLQNAGSICNIAGFNSNNGASFNAFSLLLLVGLFIGSFVGTLRSLGISQYLSRASNLISTISTTCSNKKTETMPIILLGSGVGVFIGILLSSNFLTHLSIMGLFINSLISGVKGLLTPVIQYAHRDIMRDHFGQHNSHLIDPGLVTIGVAGGGIGYTLSAFFLASNIMIGILIGIIIIAAGGFLIKGKGKIPTVVPILFLIIIFGLLVPPFIQSVHADDGGRAECGDNWDQCAGSDRVKEEAANSATAAAAGVAIGVAIGGIGSVAAQAAAMARTRKEAFKGEEDTEEGPIGYILQLSKDSLTIGIGKNDSFTATVWKVEKDGSYSQEPSASISVTTPDLACLSLSETSGTGSLPVTVSLIEPSNETSANLTIHASAGGEDFSTQVSITIEASLQVGFE